MVPKNVVIPADWVPGPKQRYWTYRNYATIPDDGHRYEVVNGVLYTTPSPSMEHQSSVVRFVYYLMAHVEFAGLGRVFVAPFDVELSPGDVVQPDVFVVLNVHLDRIVSSRVIGAPDLVIEVASPSTSGHDRREKQDAYARAEVLEYWVVTPDARTIEVLVLEGDTYSSLGVFRGQEMLPSQIVPNMPVKTEQFFVGLW